MTEAGAEMNLVHDLQVFFLLRHHPSFTPISGLKLNLEDLLSPLALQSSALQSLKTLAKVLASSSSKAKNCVSTAASEDSGTAGSSGGL